MKVENAIYGGESDFFVSDAMTMPSSESVNFRKVEKYLCGFFVIIAQTIGVRNG